MMLPQVALLSPRRARRCPLSFSGGLLIKHPHTLSMTGGAASLQGAVGAGLNSALSIAPPPKVLQGIGPFGGCVIYLLEVASKLVRYPGIRVLVILDEGVDLESVCRRSDGGDRKAAGAASG